MALVIRGLLSSISLIRDPLKYTKPHNSRTFSYLEKPCSADYEVAGTTTECFIDLGKLILLKISLPWSKSVKLTVEYSRSPRKYVYTYTLRMEKISIKKT